MRFELSRFEIVKYLNQVRFLHWIKFCGASYGTALDENCVRSNWSTMPDVYLPPLPSLPNEFSLPNLEQLDAKKKFVLLRSMNHAVRAWGTLFDNGTTLMTDSSCTKVCVCVCVTE